MNIREAVLFWSQTKSYCGSRSLFRRRI